jgi:hypothetical protein
MTRMRRIIADKNEKIGANPSHPRHPRSIDTSFAANTNMLIPYRV